jgi:hypothetical protein
MAKLTPEVPSEVLEAVQLPPAEVVAERHHMESDLDDAIQQALGTSLTEAMNRVLDEVGAEDDQFSQRALRRTLEQIEW